MIDGFLIHGNGTVKKTFPAPLSVPVLNLLSDREAEPEEPTDGPELPAVGGRRRPRTPTTSSATSRSTATASGSPTSPPRTGPATTRSSTHAGNYGQIARPAARPPAPSPAPPCRCTTRPVDGAAPARPLGPHRRAPGRHAALRVRRRRAGQGRARQHARRHPAATDRGARGPLREHALQARRHHRPVQRRQDPGALPDASTHYQRLMAQATDRAVRRGWLLPPDARDHDAPGLHRAVALPGGPARDVPGGGVRPAAVRQRPLGHPARRRPPRAARGSSPCRPGRWPRGRSPRPASAGTGSARPAGRP